MKLSYALVPIATLCSVLAHGQAPPGATPVSFTEEGLANAARVGIKSPNGDAAKSVEQALAFFKRNPKVVKSVMAEVDKKENAGAKAEGIKLFMEMYQGEGGLDLYQAKLKAVSYAYEHPELLKLAQDILFRVKKDNPTIADNYFMTWEMIAKSDPGLIAQIKEHVIKFSEANEKEYKQIVEMVIKTALIDPGFSANVFNHILRVDREACSGAAGECDCGGEGEGGQKGGDYSAPASTTSESPEPTEILDDAAAEESPEEEEEAPEGEVQDDEEVEGEGESGESGEAPEVDEDPAEGEGSLEGETEEEEAPAGEGEGEAEAEGKDEAETEPAQEEAVPAGEGEAEAEGDEEAETEPAQEEAVPAEAGEGSYARPAEPKPLGYSRPAEPKPLGYARPE